MKRGKFFTVEGTDGSGKTTQYNLIADYLRDKGCDVVAARDPGGTKIGEDIRRIILDSVNSEMDNMTELMLYASSRAQLVAQVIKPAIERGSIVICDRFVDSNIAYQGFGRGMGTDLIRGINHAVTQGIEPDLTFFFDLPPGISMDRIGGSADRLESEPADFHKRVYEGYMHLCREYPERIRRIECIGGIEDVFDKVRALLDMQLA